MPLRLQQANFASSSAARVSWMMSAIMPSVGAAIFAVSLVHVLFISGGTRSLFRDSDAGWHIRNGEAILRNIAVPRADQFSFTVPAKEWFAWEWLSDVLLGTAHRLAGPAGVALLAAIVIALTAWGASRFALSLGGNLPFTAIAAAVLLGTTSIHWLARPHIFSWLIALIFLAIVERHRRRSGIGNRDSGLGIRDDPALGNRDARSGADSRFPIPDSRVKNMFESTDLAPEGQPVSSRRFQPTESGADEDFQLREGLTSVRPLQGRHSVMTAFRTFHVRLLTVLPYGQHTKTNGGQIWYLLPLLSCLWANLHASFLLGPGILFVYAAGEWLNQLQSNVGTGLLPRTGRGGSLVPTSAIQFGILGVASLAATLINPYGWKLHAHIASYLHDGYIMDHIAEFRSFSFHTPGAIFVELFLVIAVLGTLAMARQRAYGPALLGIVLLHFSLYSARYLPEAAVLLLPLSVAALTREAEKLSMLRGFLRYFERVRNIDREIWGAVPVLVVLALTIGALAASARADRVGFDPAKFPVYAAEYLEHRDLNSRVYAHDQWGGYLIYRFDGRLKVFMDGRSDYYGRDMLETHAQINEVKPGWDTALKSFRVKFVLAPPDRPLAAVLALKPEWKQVYADSTAVVFERVG